MHNELKTRIQSFIAAWFERVKQIRQEYGIEDNDVYNFDETGFAMGIANLELQK